MFENYAKIDESGRLVFWSGGDVLPDGNSVTEKHLLDMGYHPREECRPPDDPYSHYEPSWELADGKLKVKEWTPLDKPSDTRAIVEYLFVALAEKGAVDQACMMENGQLFIMWDKNWTGKAGTIVRHNGKLYKSIHDTVVGENTEPDKSPTRWTLIADPREEWPGWIAPLGTYDAYPLGAKVTHNGSRWVSDSAINTWEPGIYGWAAFE